VILYPISQMKQSRVSEAEASLTRLGQNPIAFQSLSSLTTVPHPPACTAPHPPRPSLVPPNSADPLLLLCCLCHCLLPSSILNPPLTLAWPFPFFSSNALFHIVKPTPTLGLGKNKSATLPPFQTFLVTHFFWEDHASATF